MLSSGGQQLTRSHAAGACTPGWAAEGRGHGIEMAFSGQRSMCRHVSAQLSQQSLVVT